MSAELLREAAAKMRGDAQSVVTPWYSVAQLIDTLPAIPAHRLADAEHIASWPPSVALAVADWLEAEATAHQVLSTFSAGLSDEFEEFTIRGAALTIAKKADGAISMRADTSGPAFAVARAYLAVPDDQG